MENLILSRESEFEVGEIIERLNRFTLLVRLNSSDIKAYLGNSGALSTVISPGRKIICEYAAKESRITDYDAFAVKLDDFYVTVQSTFANDIFSNIVRKSIVKEFKDYSLAKNEPQFPEHGRADFLLEKDLTGDQVYVEVKSCTHVEDGVAKFPDKPTERGRRHLKNLRALVEEGNEAYMAFFVQRPDAEVFRPFESVDPEFYDLLRTSKESGVKIFAFSTEYRPSNLYLKREELPIEL